MTFQLHPQLEADCHLVTDLPLCSLLLMDDARYPWCILVPRISAAREIHHLDTADQTALWRETAEVAGQMEKLYEADKMNVAALGNLVPQLHVHVVARSTRDTAWPQPVWGVGKAEAYPQRQLTERLDDLRRVLSC